MNTYTVHVHVHVHVQCVIIYCNCVFLAAPKLSNDSMSDTLRIHSGSSHVIEVPFTAHPQPEVTWSHNNKTTFPDARRFRSETVSGLTSLTLSKVVREDAGKVKVELKNEYGACSYEVKVIVVGKFTKTSPVTDLRHSFISCSYFSAPPSPPLNLVQDETSETTVQLSWQPPSDDGGSDVTGYVIERRDAKRTSWTKV